MKCCASIIGQGSGDADFYVGPDGTAAPSLDYYDRYKRGWYNADGSMNFPPNNGAVPGSEKTVTLQAGDKLGRYGGIGEESAFVTQPGASADSLSLPPNTNPSTYQELTVLKPIPGVTQGTVAPWGGSVGGGLQYLLPQPIKWYQLNGYLSK